MQLSDYLYNYSDELLPIQSEPRYLQIQLAHEQLHHIVTLPIDPQSGIAV